MPYRSPHLPPLPQRQPLSLRACEHLRELIVQGELSGLMPGELELARRLQVSRMTLRTALAQLESEGWVKSSQGRRREVIYGARRALSKAVTSIPRVILLSPVPLSGLLASKWLWIDELREQLADTGVMMEVAVSKAITAAKPDKRLSELLACFPESAWVLQHSSPAAQRWFARQGVPVVIAGSRYKDVSLPCVDVDYFAACRHAAGALKAKGCQRLGLIIPRKLHAGDEESEAGFLQGAEGATVMIGRHEGNRESVCRTVDSLMHEAQPPQGFLVCHSTHAACVLGHLQHQGWSVPRQVKLISRDDDPFLDHVTPDLARYTLSPSTYASHIARRLLRSLRNVPSPTSAEFLLPKFQAGASL